MLELLVLRGLVRRSSKHGALSVPQRPDLSALSPHTAGSPASADPALLPQGEALGNPFRGFLCSTALCLQNINLAWSQMVKKVLMCIASALGCQETDTEILGFLFL